MSWICSLPPAPCKGLGREEEEEDEEEDEEEEGEEDEAEERDSAVEGNRASALTRRMSSARSKYANLRRSDGLGGEGGSSALAMALSAEVSTKLPIYAFRKELQTACLDNDTTVVVGETGSGKSTQLPKYLLDELVRRDQGTGSSSVCNVIACTQPRRVAAVTVARRVAQEMGCAVGR